MTEKPDFDQGFNNQNDTFRRQPFYEQVMRVVNNAPEENLVLSLDDNWGNGKTSFVKMMKAEIEKEEPSPYNVIYFDAFENDYQSDPFISLTAQFYSLIKKDEGKLKPFLKRFMDTSVKVGSSLLIGSVKAVITTASANFINGDKVVDAAIGVGKETAEKMTDELESFIQKKITSADEEKSDIEAFKKLLSEMHVESNKKTIFIIDELDRARPDYALDLLEKVKHLFSVNGVVFLLVMNRNQFEKSIEQRYGKIDSRTYLNKFINYWLSLPKKRAYEYTPHNGLTETTINDHLVQINKKGGMTSRNGVLLKSLSYLLDINDCSLREAERCYALLQITSTPRIINGTTDGYLASLAIVLFLKVWSPIVLNEFIQKKISIDEFYAKTRLSPHSEQKPVVHNMLLNAIEYHYLPLKSLSDENIRKQYRQFTNSGYNETPMDDYYQQLQNLSLQ
ncbi:P-loop NTPase fold protein [Pantoea sp. NPDC088449]|uniref:KAP family P-loop NTPase fold protein n=1 Tax=Pantoea sp. NPDC088449 TaxID=3364392 RepID=UPI00380D2760